MSDNTRDAISFETVLTLAERESGAYGLADEGLRKRVAAMIDWINARGPYSVDQIGGMRRQINRLLVNRLKIALDRKRFPEITGEKISLALEDFLLTLTSFDAKFDRVLRGVETFTTEEQRGFELFSTEYDPRRGQYGADCFHCHGGPLFQSQTFANNGLDDQFTEPGRARATSRPADAGKFAVPSLRNVALTGPYMHDGRFKTLEEVVAHYCTGIKRSATLDPNLAKHPDGGVPLSAADQKALVAFLQTLTDEKLILPQSH